MLISLLLQLHLRRKENLPSVKWLPLGITVYAECSFSLFQMHFKAFNLLVKEKSMFSPAFSGSPIILVFFILAILFSQMILR